jgi:tetratricopeptide (TPR) repeat protein
MIGVVAIGALLALQAPQGPLPEVITRSRVDRGRGVDFHALVVPETVYVGQQATYQLGVFLDQETRQRIRRNPEFQPPETRSLLSYDLKERAPGSITGNVDGRTYEMHIFRRALFPLTPGRYPIPQARLTYTLPQTASFFSREESFTLRSEEVAFVAIEPPIAGRPSDWAGAVGSWNAVARMDTARGRAGEPFILTLRIEGQGNVTLLPRPSVRVAWASVVNADERVRLDSTPSLLGGWKEFDWLVTPSAAGVQRVPALRYSYFNPRTRRYEIATTTPFDVRVATGDVAVAPERAEVPAAAEQPFELRPTLGAGAPHPIGQAPIVIGLVLLAPLAAFAAWMARRPRRVKPPPTPHQRLAALRDASSADAIRSARNALIDGLRARTGLVAADLTAPGAWTMALRKVGVSPPSAAAVEALLGALDAASYASVPPEQPKGAGWSAQAAEALRIVDDEAWGGRGGRPRPVRTPAAVSIVLIGLLAAQTFAAPLLSAQGDASGAFAQGMTAYAGGDYVRAERHFEDATRENPRSAAAWANYAAAAFLAHDTASAVVGWQRALRLDPTDADARANLARVRAPQEVGVARVLPIPGTLAISAALLLWLTGWALAARQAWRRRPALRLALLALVVGGAALALAWRHEQRLEGVNLVVVTSPAPLRSFPSLGAETKSTPLRGEVGEVIERTGVWVRLRLEGNRDGWLPREQVTPLHTD